MIPPWEGTFENWSRKWVTQNFWRVQHLFIEREDALQECALLFSRVANKYGDVVDNPAWFMALYKRAVSNCWIFFSLRDFNMRRALKSAAEQQILDRDQHIEVSLGPALVRLQECSPEVRRALVVLANAPPSTLRRVFGVNTAAAVNKRLRELCDEPQQINYVAELHRLPPRAIQRRRVHGEGWFVKRPMKLQRRK